MGQELSNHDGGRPRTTGPFNESSPYASTAFMPV